MITTIRSLIHRFLSWDNIVLKAFGFGLEASSQGSRPTTESPGVSSHEATHSKQNHRLDPDGSQVQREIIPFQNLGSLRGKYSERSLPTIRGIVFHTTGVGSWNRWKRDNPSTQLQEPDYPLRDMSWRGWLRRKGKEPFPFDTCLRIYGSLMVEGPHFVVCGETGRIAQGAALNVAAWHVGRQGRKQYLGGPGEVPAFWRDAWPQLDTPLDLLGGNEWTEANLLTVGVEIAPPSSGPRAPLTDECWQSLAWLVEMLSTGVWSELPNLVLDEYHLVTHWDLHPLSRMKKDGTPTDLPTTQWSRQLLREKILDPVLSRTSHNSHSHKPTT